MSKEVTITIDANGNPKPEEVGVVDGDTVRWLSEADDWIIRFPLKDFFLEVNHWPFKGGQSDILVSHATGSLEYVAERNLLRKEYPYKTARRNKEGKNGPMSNGARIIIR